MYMDSEKFENWMERIMERFDRTEKLLEKITEEEQRAGWRGGTG